MAYHVFFLIFYNPNTGRHHHVASFPILDITLKVPVTSITILSVFISPLNKSIFLRKNEPQPFQAWIYHCHHHPLQAANCCRNSRLVVDVDDLKWVENALWGLKGLKLLDWICFDLNCTNVSNFYTLDVVCRGSETPQHTTSSGWKFNVLYDLAL